MDIAGVITLFPKTTLSGTATGRLAAQVALLAATPANRQIRDEQGDLLVVAFSTGPLFIVHTQKGKERRALESSRSPGY